jgi:hypothetical protein
VLHASVPPPQPQHPWYTLHLWLNWLFNFLLLSSVKSKWFEVGFFLVGVVTACLGAALQVCDPSDQRLPAVFVAPATFLHTHRLVIFCGLAVAQAISWGIVVYLRWLQPIDLDKSKAILDQAVAEHFADQKTIKCTYRATLFKVRGVWWITREWLGIVSRSGEKFDRSNTIFSIDKMKDGCNTGIAGRCWFGGGNAIIRTKLLNPDDPANYQSECSLSPREHAKINLKATVIMAVGVRRKGKLWGVLVLDTDDIACLPLESAHAKNSEGRHEQDINRWAFILGQLIA